MAAILPVEHYQGKWEIFQSITKECSHAILCRVILIYHGNNSLLSVENRVELLDTPIKSENSPPINNENLQPVERLY